MEQAISEKNLPFRALDEKDPPAMMTAMKETLTSAGANEDDIRSEDFAGY